MRTLSSIWNTRRIGTTPLYGCLILASLGGTCDGPALPIPPSTANDTIDPASTDGNTVDDPTDNQVAGSTPTLPVGQVRAQPTQMTATAVAAHQIDLTWKDNASDEEGFLLQRYSADSGWTNQATLAADTTTYSDTSIATETNYCYRVTAFKGTQQTAPSPLACAKTSQYDGNGGPTEPGTPNRVPEGAPTLLTTSLSAANEVVLTWQDNCSDEEGFLIRRFVTGAQWTDYATAAADATTFVDQSVVPGTSYCYRVLAFKGTAQTAATGVACASPLEGGSDPDSGTANAAPPDGMPGSVTVTALSSDQIQIQWQDNSSNEEGFKITRYTASGGWADLTQTAAGVTQYTDQGLQPSTSYCYRIAAFNSADTTAYTTLKCATTPAAAATGGGSGSGGSGSTPSTTGDECYVNCASAAPQRAFPSAEGFGAQAKGGRGGRTLRVTTLEDYNTFTDPPEAVITGSLRWAMENQTGPRTIVFALGGTIMLKRPIRLAGENGSYVTLAGQTAPGDGIQIGGWGLEIFDGAHDVVVRHVRIRPTMPTHLVTEDDLGELRKKAIQIWSRSAPTDCHDLIFDHCSFEWGLDSSIGLIDARRVTFQWCIIGEGSLYGDYLPAGVYAADPGFSLGGAASQGMTTDCTETYDDFLSLHHTLFIHNRDRNITMNTQGCVVEFVNNFVYNHLAGARVCQTGNVTQSTRVNFIGNRYLPGPNGQANMPRRYLSLHEYCTVPSTANNAPTLHCLYVRDNLDDYWRTSAAVPDWAVTSWVHYPGYNAPPEPPYENCNFYNPLPESYRMSTPFAGAAIPITVHAAATLESTLAPQVGATLPRRDTVDTRLIHEWSTRTGRQGIGNQQQPPAWNVDGYLIQSGHDSLPTLNSGTAPADTDRDGIPDAWETAQGLNPNSAADAKADPDCDGYTNLEEYLNYLAGEQ